MASGAQLGTGSGEPALSKRLRGVAVAGAAEALEGLEELFVGDGFREVLGEAGVEALADDGFAAVAADGDALRAVSRLQLAHQVQAAAVGEFQVGQQDGERLALGELYCLGVAVGGFELEVRTEQPLENADRVAVVVDGEDAAILAGADSRLRRGRGFAPRATRRRRRLCL